MPLDIRPVREVGAVFVHGLFSSPRTWSHFEALIAADRELAHIDTLPFGYVSPVASFSPLRRIPSFDDVADSLGGFLEVEGGGYERLVLVSHSQGGLVVQRYLARMLNEGRGTELARISRVVMFACPNSGSELALTLRRALWRRGHAQERQLRPIHAAVTEAQRTVLTRVVHARSVTANSCPLPVTAFAGETDGIVTPASAKSLFPDTGVLPGDHSGIIRPDSPGHRSYTALKRLLLTPPDGATGSRTSDRERGAAPRSGRTPTRGTEPARGAEPDVAGPGDWRSRAMVDHDENGLFGIAPDVERLLRDLAGPTGPWVVNVRGVGGVGKTTMAYEAARRAAREGIFDRIVWTTVRGGAHEPGLWEALFDLAAQLGVSLGPDRRGWEAELGVALRAAGEQRRVLVVVDNLEVASQATAIVDGLRGAGVVRPHKLLVTSRGVVHDPDHAIKEQSVTGLTQEAAVAFIRHVGADDPELADATGTTFTPIVRITEGNPYLMRLAIRRYLSTGMPLHEVIDELTALESRVPDGGEGLATRIKAHLFDRSLGEFDLVAGADAAHSLMAAFCAKRRGDRIARGELMELSGLADRDFRHALRCGHDLELVQASRLNEEHSIHSLLYEYTKPRPGTGPGTVSP
ncbi:alpha/beta hydrolase [Streptomyces sp. IB2014 016-6]|uniref:alpha/beta fold hydrolase n=1 Tax=Streptomyces sp. IB2014 016-6 TaxID=2517818 RepID=UPI0011CC7DD8|nr:alpha/beta hydrolase [Streptomyces sp. IB2014 016-6]TXL90018.1 alpha/beta hydrolase [Streptomyces sp. IB2014 016-6]